MTGEKTRGTSLEKLWKLDDPELTTPKHDALVLSLLDWEYTKKVISLDDEEFLISIKSEVPITTTTNFIVGYADVVLHTAHWKIMRDNSFKGNGSLFPHLFTTQFIIECKPTIRSFGETLRQIKTYKQYVQYDSLFDKTLKFYGFKDKSKYPKCEKMRDRVDVSDHPDERYWIILSPDEKYSDAFENENIILISPTI